MSRLISVVRSNAIALLALFFALGGTGMAAVDLANHSVTPVKLNNHYIGGYVRAWAGIGAGGKVDVSGGKVLVRDGLPPGGWVIDWVRPKVGPSCRTIATIDYREQSGALATPGYAVAGTDAEHDESIVEAFNSQGQLAALPLDVELVCATPR